MCVAGAMQISPMSRFQICPRQTLRHSSVYFVQDHQRQKSNKPSEAALSSAGTSSSVNPAELPGRRVIVVSDPVGSGFVESLPRPRHFVRTFLADASRDRNGSPQFYISYGCVRGLGETLIGRFAAQGALASIGVVYGNIGTSAPYALKEDLS
jgi:hypothetical protein